MKKNQKISIVVALFLLGSFASSASAAYSLPADRSVNWQGNVGVLGGIPNRSTICATLNPSGTDDTAAIQIAINNCPVEQVVKLNAGTFSIKSPIILKSKTTLRGAGMGITKIQGIAGYTSKYLIQTSENKNWGASIDLTSGTSKGSATISTATAHGWKVGDIILVDQINDPSGNPPVTNIGYKDAYGSSGRFDGTYNTYRSMGQLVKILLVPNSTTATLEMPLYWNYNSALHPQGVKVIGTITSSTGIESLTVDNSLSYNVNQFTKGTIYFSATENSWIDKVEVIGSYTSAVKLWVAYRNTIRGSKFHEGSPMATVETGTEYGTSRAYGIYPTTASANIVENNYFYHITGSIFPTQFTGNAFAYNYISQLYLDDNFQPYAMTFHGAHSAMNLIEGNYIDGRVAADNVWGTSSHNTYLRNKVSLNPNEMGGGTWNVDLQYGATYFNFIGNILGTAGVENTYELSNVNLAGQKSIYRFGYTRDGDNDAIGNSSRPYATILRHGNWDSVTKGTLWNGTDDRTLPSSFYLTSKPTWWGNSSWPAIGPDLTPMTSNIPAMSLGTSPAPTPEPTPVPTPEPAGCSALTFVSGSAAPASVDVNASYSMSCDYGVGNINSIKAVNDLGGCTFAGFVGTAATFTCNAGAAGTRTNTCSLIAGTTANTCAQTNQINAVAVSAAVPAPVVVTYSIADFAELTVNWLKTVSAPGDVNKDGNVNAQDLGIMMSNWK